MAHVDVKSRSRVGRYGVDVAAIDRIGVTAVRAAIEHTPIIVVDEIGKMELFSPQFQAAVLKAVSSPKIVVATAMIDNLPWVTALKALPNVTVWEVTKENRSAMVERVMQWVKAEQ
jgi:nucleoside-triphosphatase